MSSKPTKFPWGIEWRNEAGQLHREDGPAIERSDGSKEYWLNGELHRSASPAVEYSDGSKYYYLNDKLHRTDGPAIEYADGSKEYYLNGKEVEESMLNNPIFKLLFL